ncbi:MAG: hypothetical protein ACFFCP_01435 [Promethearchaeota archaeon]
MYKREQMVVCAISILIVMTAFTVVLLQPMNATVVVTFGNSDAEYLAVSTLTQNIDNVAVVRYGTIEYNLAKLRCSESIIFVGHGSEDGISSKSGLVRDTSIAQDIRSTSASNIYVLACNSGGLADQEGLEGLISFRGFIDAELGALAIATRINLSRGLAKQADDTFNLLINVFTSKLFGRSPYLPLRIIDGGGGGGGGGGSSPPPTGHYLSAAELNNFIATLIISNIIALICASAVYFLSAHFAAAASESVVIIDVSWRTLLKSLLIYIAIYGATSAGAAINTIFGGVTNLAFALAAAVSNAVNIAISRMNPVEWLVFIGLTALEIIAIILTAGVALEARLAVAAVVATVNACIIGVADYSDSDGTPCMSLLEAISQLCR